MRARSGTSLGRRALDVLGAVLTALLVVAATPAVLFLLVGDPLGHGLGHDWTHWARVAMATLTGVAWMAWAACCVQLGREVVIHVRSGHAGVPAGAALSERIAARIAAGILAVSALGAPLAFPSGAGAARPGAGHVSIPTVVVRASPGAETATDDAAHAADTAPAVTATYVVRPGDSLWSIAEDELGDGGDWTAIAALNLGHTMADGRIFVDPSVIYAGWRLTMPTAVPASPGPSKDPAVAVPAPAAPGHPRASTSAPAAPTQPVTAPGNTHSVRIVTGPFQPVVLGISAPEAGGHRPAPPTVATGSAGLPELLVLGFGAIGCGALTRRARRARLLRRATTLDGDAPREQSDPATDADALLARFAGVPALTSFERANCLLAQSLAEPSSAPHGALVRAVCVGTTGVDFWLDHPIQDAPAPFTRAADGRAWHVDHRALDAVIDSRPLFPIVLPVGDDGDGTWLVPLRPGGRLPLLGPAADSLWRAARCVQEAWEWSESVLITDDPAAVAAQLEQFGAGVDGGCGEPPNLHDLPAILFHGDPACLPAALQGLVSIVTTASTAVSDVMVLVDARAASIHPLGRTVRPHLVTTETAAAVDELMEVPPESADADSGIVTSKTVWARSRSEGTRPSVGAATGHDVTQDVLGPGVVEVRLLTVTPRIEGLHEELPPNRARRAVELVAYLALHRPDDVTSDRLRTRVLGSSSADAASKTLFNTAAAARRAMGTDAEGHPLLPPGTRTGHYRVADSVTVDVQRAVGLAALGSAAEDPEVAMAHLRASLALVEGEPLANALSGYTWWEAEGHGARIAAVLVNAACDLAALAVDAGRFELARWGLGQARLVDPYSEALSRVAMQVAAAAGDPDRLRREWRDCQRRVDELDPGSSPSQRTERLYGELSRRVLVGAHDANGHHA